MFRSLKVIPGKFRIQYLTRFLCTTCSAWAELISRTFSGSGAFSERSSGECPGARDGKLAMLSRAVVNMLMRNSVNAIRRVGTLVQDVAKKKQRREKRRKTCTKNSSGTAKQRAGPEEECRGENRKGHPDVLEDWVRASVQLQSEITTS